jgi:D-alanyl-D-alanine carboxypeptidase
MPTDARRRTLVNPLLAAALLVTCIFGSHGQAQTLEGTDWVLNGYGGKTVLEETQITAQFEEGRVSGSAGCNRYFGSYEARQGGLKISEVASTKMACPDPIMAQEDAYLKLLRAAKSYQIEAGELYLLDGDGRAILEFVMAGGAPDLPIEGTDWVLSGYGGKTVLEETEITARFEDGRLSGSAGCNRYFGSYEAREGGLKISEVGSTMMACPDPIMAQEDAYLKLLKAAKSYQVEAGELYLLDGDGRAALEFVPKGVGSDAGEPVEVLELGQPTVLRDGHLWVPLRPLLDWLGADLGWDAATQTAVGARGDRRLEVTIGSAEARVNGRAVALPAAAFEVNGRTYIPLNLLSDSFGVVIEPNPGTHTVTLIDGSRQGDLPSPGEMPDEQAARWQEFLDKVVDLENGGTLAAPGAVLFVDSPEGPFLGAAGIRDIETGTPVQVGDPLQIGSCTKAFTVVLALQLQEEGVWSLDDPVVRWLPDLATLVPDLQRSTLRQLAQNTSGLPDYAEKMLGSAVGDPAVLAKGYAPQELIAYAFENGKPEFDPGTSWGYSSTNFVLLGMAIEAVTGQSLGDLYAARIFDRVGMGNSFLLEGVPAPGQIVHGYYRGEGGELVDSTGWNASQGWAAGAIVSTAEDMGRFVRSLIGGDLFRDPQTLDEMLDLKDIPPARQAGGYARYGLGVASTDMIRATNVGHTGQTLCFTSLWMYLPDSRTSIVMMSNSADCSLLPILAAEMRNLLGDEEGTPQVVRRAVLTTP